MVYSQIKDGVIVNQIVLDDVSLEPLFSEGYDYLIRTDNLDPSPRIGDNYDGVNFSLVDQPDQNISDLDALKQEVANLEQSLIDASVISKDALPVSSINSGLVKQ